MERLYGVRVSRCWLGAWNYFCGHIIGKKRIFKMFGRYQRESGYRKGFYSRSGKVGKEKMRLKLLASELGED